MNFLNPQPTKDNPHIVPDYPYGFKLRCQMRVWREYKASQGYRYVTQTSNPKRPGEWNKPKASTYHYFILVGIKDNGHVHYETLGFEPEVVAAEWLEKYADILTDDEKGRLKYIIKRTELEDKYISYTVRPLAEGEVWDVEGQRKKEQEPFDKIHALTVHELARKE